MKLKIQPDGTVADWSYGDPGEDEIITKVNGLELHVVRKE
jgi:hypothetical protein